MKKHADKDIEVHKWSRRTAHHSNGQIVVVATDPDPLPLFCVKRFDNFGSDL